MGDIWPIEHLAKMVELWQTHDGKSELAGTVARVLGRSEADVKDMLMRFLEGRL